jgi:hypothetical protein
MNRVLRDVVWLIILGVAIFALAAPAFGADPSPAVSQQVAGD